MGMIHNHRNAAKSRLVNDPDFADAVLDDLAILDRTNTELVEALERIERLKASDLSDAWVIAHAARAKADGD